jgi:hypothetical protein
MRFSLRTLVLLSAIAPPASAGIWFFGVDVVTSGAFIVAASLLLYLLFAFLLGYAIAWIAATTVDILARLLERR